MLRTSRILLLALAVLVGSTFSSLTSAVAAPPGAPTVESPPALTGYANVGQVLTASPGTWTNAPTGSPTPGYATDRSSVRPPPRSAR